MDRSHIPFLSLFLLFALTSLPISTCQLLNTLGSLLGGGAVNNKGTSSKGLLGLDLLGLDSILSLPQSLLPSAEHLSKIDPNLLQILSESPLSDILVNYGGNDEVIQEIESQEFPTILEKREALIKALKVHASKKQSSGKSLLSSLSISKSNRQSFWIANNMIVNGADLNLVQSLAMLQDVTSIGLLPTIKLNPLISPFASLQNVVNSGKEVQWGVLKILAPEVWNVGINGQGVVVASIDSGVRCTHESLRGNMRDNYNWFDPALKTKVPTDNNGHGTHTMGTICGANGIGVAPGSKWIACRGCTSSSCPSEALLGCGQWMMEPTLVDGTKPNAAKCPDVINNSWGSMVGGDVWYNSVVNAWNAAGIRSVFAIGNAGPLCSTAGSPGDQASCFSAGATDLNDNLASFSSKGFLIGSKVKPEISAPGKDVYSCWHTGDSSYNTISGTSMAAPHVVGIMALMLSAHRATTVEGSSAILSLDHFITALEKGADTEGLGTGPASLPCDFAGLTGKFPNSQFGHGRANARKSVAETLRL